MDRGFCLSSRKDAGGLYRTEPAHAPRDVQSGVHPLPRRLRPFGAQPPPGRRAGGAAAASERSQAQAKSQQDTVQQTSETIESNPIPNQSGGGGSSYGRNSPEEETGEPPKEKLPQDPLGRGQNLDFSA